VAILLSTADVFSRQMEFFTDPMGSMTEPTILHRIISYRGFINQFLERPISGIGWGARSFFWGRTRIYSFWEVRHTVSHTLIEDFGGLNSMFLNQAVKGGLISLAAVFTVIAGIIAAVHRAMKRGHGIVVVGLLAGLIGFYGHQVVGNQIQWAMANAAYWFSIGLIAAFGTFGPAEGGSKDRSEGGLLGTA
jgi:O-antigen ligase